MKQTKKYDLCQQQFIHDQRLFRLELTRAEQHKTLHFLKLEHLPQSGLDILESEHVREQTIDRDYRSRWREIAEFPRHRVLAELPSSGSGRLQRQLLCITASGGIGKSIALAQLSTMRPQVLPGHIVFSFHISELPDRWEQYVKSIREWISVELDELGKKRETRTQREPLLIENLRKRFAEIGEARAGRLPNDSDRESLKLRDWIIAEIRLGNVTLVVDGLDELPASDGHAKVQALRLLLSHYDRLHCVVGGRPNAITNDYWRDLFATSKDPNRSDESSQWEFWLAGLFDSDQIRRDLGNARFQQLQLLQGNIEFNPRTLEILRTLEIETFKTLRSGADVYWHSVYRSLQLDRKKEGQYAQTFLTVDEIIDILSAMAITMLMWKHDPRFPDGNSPDFQHKRQTLKSEAPTSEPTRQISKSELNEFNRRVFERLAELYPTWKAEEYKIASCNLQELKRLNTHYLEITYLVHSEEKMMWRNISQRDFFAALWMIRSASLAEVDWFGMRKSVLAEETPGEQRYFRTVHEPPIIDTFLPGVRLYPELYQTWKFICGMPECAFEQRRGNFAIDERWATLVNFIFAKTAGMKFRPTELMHVAFPCLLVFSGFLDKKQTGFLEMVRATNLARKQFTSILISTPKDVLNAKLVLSSFLNEYSNDLKRYLGAPGRDFTGELSRFSDFDTNDGLQISDRITYSFYDLFCGRSALSHLENSNIDVPIEYQRKSYEAILGSEPFPKRLKSWLQDIWVFFGFRDLFSRILTVRTYGGTEAEPSLPSNVSLFDPFERYLTCFDAAMLAIWCGESLFARETRETRVENSWEYEGWLQEEKSEWLFESVFISKTDWRKSNRLKSFRFVRKK